MIPASELTKEERNAISTLERLAKRWPESLWLFSGSGRLWVMRKNAQGEQAYTPRGGNDQAYCVKHIEIENDGGDW